MVFLEDWKQMASSGQAFNSLSYCVEGMELSKAATCQPLTFCLPWVTIMVYSLGKERLEAGAGWFAAMDGDVEHVP